MTHSHLDGFVESNQLRLPSVLRGFEQTKLVQTNISSALIAQRSLDDDTSFVVFGSLARGDYTVGSDIDWSLLIDGQAIVSHHEKVTEIEAVLKSLDLKTPSAAGQFAAMTFSHPLVHYIGGELDSNKNMSQRILLLWESQPLAKESAHKRVINAIVSRYLDQETSFVSGEHLKVPRFLLNDMVRLWRTIAVDFANKHRSRDTQKWGIRNVKLRMSRKLLFVSGMMMCLSCRLNLPRQTDREGLTEHLLDYIALSPLDRVVHFCTSNKIESSYLIQFLTAYDEFLTVLDDEDNRKILNALKSENAQDNPVFEECKRISSTFSGAIDSIFFKSGDLISEATRTYAIF